MSQEQKIVEACNNLARQFYAMHGNVVKDDFKFYNATHPQEVGMWNMAVLAYDHIEGTDVMDALQQVEDAS
jgi:hypothetical protein